MSSLSDLTKLAQNLLRPQNDNSLLSATTLREWLKPLFSFWDGASFVGMPWEIRRIKIAFHRRTQLFSKGLCSTPGSSSSPELTLSEGVFPSQYSTFTIVPSHSFAVVILAAGKQNPVPELHRLAMEYFLPAFDSALIRTNTKQLVGKWASPNGESKIDITILSGRLYATQVRIGGEDPFGSAPVNLVENENEKLIPIWEMGHNEFRHVFATFTFRDRRSDSIFSLVPTMNSSNTSPCFTQWASIDSMEHKNGEATNYFQLLPHGNDPGMNRLVVPSTGQILYRTG